MKELNIPVTDEKINQLYLQGKTIVFLIIEGELIGAIALADIIRPESKEAISKLRKMGI